MYHALHLPNILLRPLPLGGDCYRSFGYKPLTYRFVPSYGGDLRLPHDAAGPDAGGDLWRWGLHAVHGIAGGLPPQPVRPGGSVWESAGIYVSSACCASALLEVGRQLLILLIVFLITSIPHWSLPTVPGCRSHDFLLLPSFPSFLSIAKGENLHTYFLRTAVKPQSLREENKSKTISL